MPRLHAAEQRRLFEGKLAMESERRDHRPGGSSPGGRPSAATDPRYRAEREQRRAETLAEIEAATGKEAAVI